MEYRYKLSYDPFNRLRYPLSNRLCHLETLRCHVYFVGTMMGNVGLLRINNYTATLFSSDYENLMATYFLKYATFVDFLNIK